jgi:hypothetical protein
METNNKYYTPDESEYHIGFEYQSLTDPRQPENDIAWSNESIDNVQELRDVCKYIIEDDFLEHRVKYLDKSDIESFGFKLKNNVLDIFINERFYINWFDSQKKPEVLGIYAYDKSIDYESQLFRGIIKNKSELSFILKRLGIID